MSSRVKQPRRRWVRVLPVLALIFSILLILPALASVVTRSFTLVVDPPAIALTALPPTSSTGAYVYAPDTIWGDPPSAPFQMQLNAAGGTGTYSWSIQPNMGSLPPGLTLSATGLISGTPSPITQWNTCSTPDGTYQCFTFPFNAQVTDGVSTVTQGEALIVLPQSVIKPVAGSFVNILLDPADSGMTIYCGVDASVQFEWVGGLPRVDPITWTGSTSVPGFTFDPATATLKGNVDCSYVTTNGTQLAILRKRVTVKKPIIEGWRKS